MAAWWTPKGENTWGDLWRKREAGGTLSECGSPMAKCPAWSAERRKVHEERGDARERPLLIKEAQYRTKITEKYCWIPKLRKILLEKPHFRALGLAGNALKFA